MNLISDYDGEVRAVFREAEDTALKLADGKGKAINF